MKKGSKIILLMSMMMYNSTGQESDTEYESENSSSSYEFLKTAHQLCKQEEEFNDEVNSLIDSLRNYVKKLVFKVLPQKRDGTRKE